jgi:hypothetical protein
MALACSCNLQPPLGQRSRVFIKQIKFGSIRATYHQLGRWLTASMSNIDTKKNQTLYQSFKGSQYGVLRIVFDLSNNYLRFTTA